MNLFNIKYVVFKVVLFRLHSLVQVASVPNSDEENGAKALSRARRASESDTVFDAAHDKNVDILQMLSKAQDEYDKVCCCCVKALFVLIVSMCF